MTKYKLTFLLLSMVLSLSSIIAQEVTDGINTYNESEKGFAWEKMNVARDHVKSMESTGLLVKLVQEDQRISYMEKRGKKAEAQLIRDNVKEENENIVKGFNKYFNYCEVYFYYPSDAIAIFKDKNFDLIYSDLNTKATGLEFKGLPYVIKYEPAPHLRYDSIKKFILYHWNDVQIQRIDRFYYPRIGVKKWTRKYKKQLSKDDKKLPDGTPILHFLIYGLNNACGGSYLED